MKLIHSSHQAKCIRAKADIARQRLWIASPFIGSWGNVRRLLGTRWLTHHVDVRVITDEENAPYLNEKTIRILSYAGKVKSLQGLHAKLYILDDFALVTSANLTGAAFSRRHEAGVCLTGHEVASAAELFEQWWNSSHCTALNVESIHPPRRASAPRSEEADTKALPIIWELPPDPGNVHLDVDLRFFGYEHFLECYADLAEKYCRIQRLWEKSPLYFEVDAFLNYLYHVHPRTPSKAFGTRAVSALTEAAQLSRIQDYAKQFARWLRTPDCWDSARDRVSRSGRVRRILKRNLEKDMTRADVETVLDQLNCMTSMAIARAKFLNNNRLDSIRKAWRLLADESVPVQKRMIDCYNGLNFCGKSIIQELVGFYDPERYPLRNQNSNCGLRFCGYKVARY